MLKKYFGSLLAAYGHNFAPKLFEVMKSGYNMGYFRRDCVAGLTVAVISIPLAMALAIASGVNPARDYIRQSLPVSLLPFWAAAVFKSAGRPEPLWWLFSALSRATAIRDWL